MWKFTNLIEEIKENIPPHPPFWENISLFIIFWRIFSVQYYNFIFVALAICTLRSGLDVRVGDCVPADVRWISRDCPWSVGVQMLEDFPKTLTLFLSIYRCIPSNIKLVKDDERCQDWRRKMSRLFNSWQLWIPPLPLNVAPVLGQCN